MLIEEFDGSGDCEIRRIDRRGLVAASAGALLLGVPGPLTTAAQSATPRLRRKADPVADPEADPEAGFGAGTGDFTLYSGRNETLVGPLVEQYAEETGTAVDVRYGGTGELAATILEEGQDTPASLFSRKTQAHLVCFPTKGASRLFQPSWSTASTSASVIPKAAGLE